MVQRRTAVRLYWLDVRFFQVFASPDQRSDPAGIEAVPF